MAVQCADSAICKAETPSIELWASMTIHDNENGELRSGMSRCAWEGVCLLCGAAMLCAMDCWGAGSGDGDVRHGHTRKTDLSPKSQGSMGCSEA